MMSCRLSAKKKMRSRMPKRKVTWFLDGECSALSLRGMDDEKTGSHSTMKLQGKISGISILLLVDSGATHNFISRKLVEALGWTWEETKSMKILMGDGHATETSGMCKEIKIETKAGRFTLDVVLFDLEYINVILGMSWLKTLGVMMVDWNTQIMKFETELGMKNLRGVNQEEPLFATLCGVLDERQEQKENGLSSEQQRALGDILTSFDDVFVKPKGLPLVHVNEHTINLKLGHDPINVRPYRYPYHQKKEI